MEESRRPHGLRQETGRHLATREIVRLIQVLSLVLAEFGIGSLLITSLLSPHDIRLGFFTFNSLLSALTTAMALVLSKMFLGGAWYDVRYLGFTVIGSTVAYGCFRLDRPVPGRLCLILSGLIGLTLGLLPMTDQTLKLHNIHTDASYLFAASALAGALLLGTTNVAMILGHWYLLMRRLSFDHLERITLILLAVIGLRIVLLLATLGLMDSIDPQLAKSFIPDLWAIHGNLFFFVMRVLWGLLLPAVLGLLVLRCVKEKANQAATGMLYVMEISVLFGELFAAYLML